MNLGAVLEVLRRFVPLAPEMLMVGGGSKSALWRQIFADVYGMDCVKTNVDQEAGSLGAAAVAAVGAGLWKSFDAVDECPQGAGRAEAHPRKRGEIPQAHARIRDGAQAAGRAGRAVTGDRHLIR